MENLKHNVNECYMTMKSKSANEEETGRGQVTYLAVYPGDVSGTDCTYSAYSAANVSLVVLETS